MTYIAGNSRSNIFDGGGGMGITCNCTTTKYVDNFLAHILYTRISTQTCCNHGIITQHTDVSSRKTLW